MIKYKGRKVRLGVIVLLVVSMIVIVVRLRTDILCARTALGLPTWIPDSIQKDPIGVQRKRYVFED
jgi:hypothetical protein